MVRNRVGKQAFRVKQNSHSLNAYFLPQSRNILLMKKDPQMCLSAVLCGLESQALLFSVAAHGRRITFLTWVGISLTNFNKVHAPAVEVLPGVVISQWQFLNLFGDERNVVGN